MEPTTRYTAVCLQTNVNVVDEFDPDPEHAERQIRKNLARQCELIDWLYLDTRLGGPKLITFSEFCLTGVPESRKVEDYLKRSVYLPGYVTEILGGKAREYDCYIACNTFEKDDNFPGMVFNCSFIVGPDGQVALKYRKNNNAQGGTPKNTNPGDIYDDYIRIEGGPEALFPVIDTPIGRLAVYTCFDNRFPEVVRCLALRGAEVVIHLTAEPNNSRGIFTESKQVRAWDNQVYLLSCNNGDTLNSKRPVNRQWGGSRIIDFNGKVLAEVPSPGESSIQATIDIDALRQARSVVNRNMLATSRFWMYAPHFENETKQTWPLSSFSIANPFRTADQMKTIGGATLNKMYERGTFVRPDAVTASNGKKYLKRYGITCLQTDVQALDDDEFTPTNVERNTRKALARNCRLIDWACEEPRFPPKMICLSEFHLTGVPESRKLSDYQTLAVELPGWVTEEYGRKAREYGVHIVGGVFERDPDWPGRVFNSAFLIGPDGKLLMKYRKNNDAQVGVTPTTNPGDIYDSYASLYGGDDAFFPVVDTELGRIGLMVCYDIRFAEVPRMLALNGAEIIVHPTAEGMTGDSWQMAKRVRAWDNAVYFVSTNNGATFGSGRPRNKQSAGCTQIIDYDGEILAQCNNEGESSISAVVDMEALRRFRSNANRVPLVISRYGTYAPIYRAYEGWPKNAFAERAIETNQDGIVVGEQAYARLVERGVVARPTGARGQEPAVLLRD
ncbi:MAG: hypothetical protein JOZ39_07925 [Chloroflexi bacterium]|nr:hypothetical protein [Chloroflexota bacterium]